MRVLVTGGAGFIGSNFVHQTLATRADAEVEPSVRNLVEAARRTRAALVVG